MTSGQDLRETTARMLAVLLPGAALYYAVITVAHLTFLPPGPRGIMAGLAATTCALLTAGAVWARTRPAAVTPIAHGLAMAVGLLATINAVVHLVVEDNPLQATNLMLVLVGAGFLLLSPVAFAAVAIATWTGFLVAMSASEAPAWDHFGFALGTATVLAGIVHVAHRRSLIRILGLQAEQAAQTAALRQAVEDLRSSESRYRALVSLSPDPVVVIVEGRIAFASPASAAMVQTPIDDIVGARVQDFLHPADRDVVSAWRRGPGVHAIRVRTRTGADIPVEVHTAPMELGGRPAVLLIARDVRARRAAEALRGEILSSINHELRTPLTSVLGAIGLLSLDPNGEVGPWARHLVDIASRNAERLRELVEDLLDLQRLEADALPIEPKALAIGSVIQPLVEHAPRPVVVQGDVESPVWGDPARLGTVFRALLNNAMKFSPRDAAVEVEVAASGPTVRVAVSDRGPGVPEELGERIFDAFQRGDGSAARQHDGVGVGLSIARGIVEAHGGRIDVANRRGGGARFVVELPSPQPDHMPRSVPVDTPAT